MTSTINLSKSSGKDYIDMTFGQKSKSYNYALEASKQKAAIGGPTVRMSSTPTESAHDNITNTLTAKGNEDKDQKTGTSNHTVTIFKRMHSCL